MRAAEPRLRLAWVSPLPPMASGISDYSAELLPLVAERANVQAVCPPPRRLFSRLRPPAGILVVRPSDFDPRAVDAAVYHLGNNPWHAFVYEAFLRSPGIAVFHDVVMHHLLAHLMVEAGHDELRYRNLLVQEYGEKTGNRVATLRRLGVASEFEKFLFPMAGDLARRATAIVVHNQDSAERILAVAPGADVTVIPHHAGMPPPELAGVTPIEARRRLRIPPDRFVVGHFGFITRPKQPEAVIGGFARLHAAFPEALLLLVGSDTTGGGLDRIVARHGVGDAVRTTGYVDISRFTLAIRAVDAVINLRYPSAGESSGTFARALAEGKPAIVNNYGSFAEVPRDVALKVELDGNQAEEVGAHLLRLARDTGFREGTGRNAARYAATVLDPRRARDQYVDLARRVAGLAAAPRG